MSELAKSIDHTFLKAAGEKDAVRKLCREARELNLSFYVGISLVILSVLLQTRRTGSQS